MRISDWSSDVCSSDFRLRPFAHRDHDLLVGHGRAIASGEDARLARLAALDLPTTVPDGTRLSHAYSLRAPRPLNASSEERRVGEEFVSSCRSRVSPYL